MREALYFRNISFSAKLDSEADVSKYGQIRPHIRRSYPARAGYGRIWKYGRISAGTRAGYDIRCNSNCVSYVLVHRPLWLCYPNTRVHWRPAAPNQPKHLHGADRWGRPLPNQSHGTSWRIPDPVLSPSNKRDQVVFVPFAVRWTYVRY